MAIGYRIKLVVSAGSRADAIARMIRALNEYDVGGIRTNIGFFRQIFEDEGFRAGHLHTGFIDEFFGRRQAVQSPPDLTAVAALAAAIHSAANGHANPPSGNGTSPWLAAGRQELFR